MVFGTTITVARSVSPAERCGQTHPPNAVVATSTSVSFQRHPRCHIAAGGSPPNPGVVACAARLSNDRQLCAVLCFGGRNRRAAAPALVIITVPPQPDYRSTLQPRAGLATRYHSTALFGVFLIGSLKNPPVSYELVDRDERLKREELTRALRWRFRHQCWLYASRSRHPRAPRASAFLPLPLTFSRAGDHVSCAVVAADLDPFAVVCRGARQW